MIYNLQAETIGLKIHCKMHSYFGVKGIILAINQHFSPKQLALLNYLQQPTGCMWEHMLRLIIIPYRDVHCVHKGPKNHGVNASKLTLKCISCAQISQNHGVKVLKWSKPSKRECTRACNSKGSGCGFLRRLLCPARRRLQLLLASSNSASTWNLQTKTKESLQ